MSAGRPTAERGSTSVVVLAVFVVGMVFVVGTGRVGIALLARARAETAADAAALAAADALALGRDPTRAADDAAATAASNGARVLRCDCAGPRVTVTVAIDVPAVGRVARVSASAEVREPLVPAP